MRWKRATNNYNRSGGSVIVGLNMTSSRFLSIDNESLHEIPLLSFSTFTHAKKHVLRDVEVFSALRLWLPGKRGDWLTLRAIIPSGVDTTYGTAHHRFLLQSVSNPPPLFC